MIWLIEKFPTTYYPLGGNGSKTVSVNGKEPGGYTASLLGNFESENQLAKVMRYYKSYGFSRSDYPHRGLIKYVALCDPQFRTSY